MNKKAKMGVVEYILIALAGIFVLSSLGMIDMSKFKADDSAKARIVDTSLCPSDGDSTFTLTVRNALNETGSETYDNTAYVYDESGALFATMTDTTAGTQVVNCGPSYKVRLVSSNADGGDSAKIVGKDGGSCEVKDNGKYIEFKAKKSTEPCNVQSKQHGVLQFKAYDNQNAGFMFDDQDSSATDWETDGVTFNTTTSGISAYALGAGDTFDVTLKVQGTSTDTDFTDFYTLILVEAPVSEYDKPTVRFDGKILDEVMDSLTAEEKVQFASYEYAYKIESGIENTIHELDFEVQPIAGVKPSSNIEIDFAAGGAYLSNNGVSVKYGAAKDDSSKTVVYSVQDVTFNIA